MPNPSKQKGDRAERLIVDLMRAHGIEAYRVPLSGSAIGFKSDVEIRLGDRTLRLESKVRSKGFSRFYKWLLNSDCVVVKADREKPLAVIPLDILCDLASRTLAKPVEKASDKSNLDRYYSHQDDTLTHKQLPAFLTRPHILKQPE